MLVFNLRFIILLIIFQLIYFHEVFTQNPGNPISEGWYADPEGTVLGDQYTGKNIQISWIPLRSNGQSRPCGRHR